MLEIEDNNKASGPDSIPLKVLKKAKDAIANYFVRFSILLLIWESFLNVWKLSTHLIIFDKIIEKMMHKRVMGLSKETKIFT